VTDHPTANHPGATLRN